MPIRDPGEIVADAKRLDRLNDAQLLEQFSEHGSDDAFKELIERYGAEIFRRCKAMLGRREDAEDALQSTFAVLARRASSKKWRQSVGQWLFRVAYNVAQKVRGKKKHRMLGYESSQATPVLTEVEMAELGEILEEELRGMSSKFRQPMALCYLRGMKQEQAAQRLGLSRRTLIRRLVEGKLRLRHRLINRGLTATTAGRMAMFMIESCVLDWLSLIDDADLLAD